MGSKKNSPNKNNKGKSPARNKYPRYIKKLDGGWLRDYFAFVSYSHKDKKFFNELMDVLYPLEEIRIFSDVKIGVGSLWHTTIATAAKSCKASIILLSHHFLRSPYIRENEINVLLQRAEANECTPYIIFLGPCQHEVLGIDRFNFINGPHQPLYKMRPAQRFEVYNNLARELASQYAKQQTK